MPKFLQAHDPALDSSLLSWPGVDVLDCMVVGDAVWDILAARRWTSWASSPDASGWPGAAEVYRCRGDNV